MIHDDKKWIPMRDQVTDNLSCLQYCHMILSGNILIE